jgi:hypothetical protein
MYRDGDTHQHSYLLGAWSNKKDAKEAGKIEETYRGGKYKHSIKDFIVDKNEYARSFLPISDIGMEALKHYPGNTIVKFMDGIGFGKPDGLSEKEFETMENGIQVFSFLLRKKINTFDELADELNAIFDMSEPRTVEIQRILRKAEKLCQNQT